MNPKKTLDRKVPSLRKPAKPRFSGIHGGSIDTWDDYAQNPPDSRPTRGRAANSPGPLCAPSNSRAAELAAFEAVLQRSEMGRRCLTFMDSIAQITIRLDLIRELERSAEQDLERLRRVILSNDRMSCVNAAPQIPHAEAELRKWRKARAAYENERSKLRYALNDCARGLSL